MQAAYVTRILCKLQIRLGPEINNPEGGCSQPPHHRPPGPTFRSDAEGGNTSSRIIDRVPRKKSVKERWVRHKRGAETLLERMGNFCKKKRRKKIRGKSNSEDWDRLKTYMWMRDSICIKFILINCCCTLGSSLHFNCGCFEFSLENYLEVYAVKLLDEGTLLRIHEFLNKHHYICTGKKKGGYIDVVFACVSAFKCCFLW